MKTHTCYLIEPFRIFKIITKAEWWFIPIRFIFWLLNIVTLGILKVIGALYYSKKVGMKCKFKLSRNFFEIYRKCMDEIYLGMFGDYSFED